ncbi:MAG: InlB B-repeat-containing protein [Alphaproteobacteria bacterium]
MPDILVTTYKKVWLFNRNGVLHAKFPKDVAIDDGAVPAIADLDGDGRNEIIINGNFWGGVEGDYNKVWVYDLGGPPHGPVMWGQLMGGEKHQGVFKGGFTVPHRAILNVSRKGPGTGTITAPGIICGTDCTETYATGTLVTLIATPAAGTRFTGWRGARCVGTGPCTVRMDKDTVVAAVFGDVFTLNAKKVGEGVVKS